jgi:RNase P/RNase MRP subunit p30
MYINNAIPFCEDENVFRTQVNLIHQLGYQGAIVEIFDETKLKSFSLKWSSKKRIPNDQEIKIESLKLLQIESLPLFLVPKITLNPKNPDHLKQMLTKWADRKIIIAVESTDKNVLEIAARDGRVDCISLSTIDHWKAITKGILSLAKQNEVFFIISLTPIFEINRSYRSRILRELYKLLQTSKSCLPSFLIGSNTTNNWLYRGPNETIAVMKTILQIAENYAKSMISASAEKLCLRFLKRQQERFIESGFEIIKTKQNPNE